MLKKIILGILLGCAVVSPVAAQEVSRKPVIYGATPISAVRNPEHHWSKVWNDIISKPITISGPWDAVIEHNKTLSDDEKLYYINLWVNKFIQFKVDGGKDKWDTANTALKRGNGDCEEFVITKYQMLVAAGFPESQLYVTVGYQGGQGHAILVAYTKGMFVKLENGNSSIEITHSMLYDFEPRVALNNNSAWVWRK